MSYNQSQKNNQTKTDCNDISVHWKTGCHHAGWLVSHALNKADVTICNVKHYIYKHMHLQACKRNVQLLKM